MVVHNPLAARDLIRRRCNRIRPAPAEFLCSTGAPSWMSQTTQPSIWPRSAAIWRLSSVNISQVCATITSRLSHLMPNLVFRCNHRPQQFILFFFRLVDPVESPPTSADSSHPATSNSSAGDPVVPPAATAAAATVCWPPLGCL